MTEEELTQLECNVQDFVTCSFRRRPVGHSCVLLLRLLQRLRSVEQGLLLTCIVRKPRVSA